MDFHNVLDDDVEEDENEFMYGGRDGLIFLIDATEPMFVKEESDEEDIPFRKCLECCKSFMLSKIISSDRDLVSIVLFGTYKSANELSAPNITTMQDLSEPSAAKIKQLEKMLSTNDLDGFEHTYGHSFDFALSDALWLCQTIFATRYLLPLSYNGSTIPAMTSPSRSRDSDLNNYSARRLSSQRILLLTNTSEPHAGAAASQRQALVRAADLAQAGVALELLHMGRAFDLEPFYKELMRLALGEDDDFTLPQPAGRIDELLERVCRLHYQKRALCSLDFTLGEGVAIAVNLYNLIRKTGLPLRVNLDRRSNEPVKSVTRYFDSVTKETMLPAELAKSQLVGDKTVLFRFDEARELRVMDQPGLRLLGFKPADRVKLHHHVKPSAFLFPEESLVKGFPDDSVTSNNAISSQSPVRCDPNLDANYKLNIHPKFASFLGYLESVPVYSGSRLVFAALLARCASRCVVPICFLVARRNATPQLVALLPQTELRSRDGLRQRRPPGFHVVYLPYADSLRALPPGAGSGSRASAPAVASAGAVVDRLRFRYRPALLDNPRLQVHWANVEALALGHSEPREVPDFTAANYVKMRSELGVLPRQLCQAVYADGYDPLSAAPRSAPVKREPSESAGPHRLKQPKSAVDHAYVVGLHRAGKVSNLKITELKTYLEGENIPFHKSAKKAELVELVEKYLN